MPSEPNLAFGNGKFFKVWTNPSSQEFLKIGPLVRFTADNKTKNVYVWEFNAGHHADVSISLKLDGPFNSLDFLKGHAGKNDDGTYQMVGSDFLQSFVGRMTGRDKSILNNLLNQDWDWVNDYIKTEPWITSFILQLGI
jgi:hypothetical protein